MRGVAGIVLAGGRSARMGKPKAALEWHGSTLVAHVSGLLARALGGPVVVVRAPGQELPPLPPSIELAEDAREGRGPLEGIAAGLRALGERATLAYVSSVDVPLLHPAFVRRVVTLLHDSVDASVPEVEGRMHPLAAAYRVSLLTLVESLLEAGRARAIDLFAEAQVRFLDEEDLLADRDVRGGDPMLDSLRNLNGPAEYEAARGLPAPPVWVRGSSGPETDLGIVHAATLGEAAAIASVGADPSPLVVLNGERVAYDPSIPLVAGDSIALDADGR